MMLVFEECEESSGLSKLEVGRLDLSKVMGQLTESTNKVSTLHTLFEKPFILSDRVKKFLYL